MKNNWESRKSLLDLRKDVESKLWWNENTLSVSRALFRSELISAMARSYADGQ